MVDYLGLADQLKRALADYTGSGGTGRTAIDQEEAVAVMRARLGLAGSGEVSVSSARRAGA